MYTSEIIISFFFPPPRTNLHGVKKDYYRNDVLLGIICRTVCRQKAVHNSSTLSILPDVSTFRYYRFFWTCRRFVNFRISIVPAVFSVSNVTVRGRIVQPDSVPIDKTDQKTKRDGNISKRRTRARGIKLFSRRFYSVDFRFYRIFFPPRSLRAEPIY